MASVNLPATPLQFIEYLIGALELTSDTKTRSYLQMAIARQKKIHAYEIKETGWKVTKEMVAGLGWKS